MGGLKGVYDSNLLRIDEMCDVWELRLDAGVEPKRPRIKVKAQAGSSEAAKWGEGKSRQDEMEYRLWQMDDLLGKLQDGRAEALQRVRIYAGACQRVCLLTCICMTAYATAVLTSWSPVFSMM